VSSSLTGQEDMDSTKGKKIFILPEGGGSVGEKKKVPGETPTEKIPNFWGHAQWRA